MNEKQLEDLWWWNDGGAWHHIAGIVWPHPSGIISDNLANYAKGQFERAAFEYERLARKAVIEKKKTAIYKPRWNRKVPFYQLSKNHIELEKQGQPVVVSDYESYGSLNGKHDPHPQRISLAGISFNPANTTKAGFARMVKEHLLPQVEGLMKEKNLAWAVRKQRPGAAPLWRHLEAFDRYRSGIEKSKRAPIEAVFKLIQA